MNDTEGFGRKLRSYAMETERRTLAVIIAAAGALLLTGCANAPDAIAAQLSQSIADGLTSAVSSLVEAAFLTVAI